MRIYVSGTTCIVIGDSQSVKRFLDQRNEGIFFEGCINTVESGNEGRFREGRLAWFPRNHIPYEAAESVLHQTLKCGEIKLLCLRELTSGLIKSRLGQATRRQSGGLVTSSPNKSSLDPFWDDLFLLPQTHCQAQVYQRTWSGSQGFEEVSANPEAVCLLYNTAGQEGNTQGRQQPNSQGLRT